MSESAKRLYRSTDNSMLGGVCGGLGEYTGIDPKLIRLVWTIVTVVNPAVGIIGYVAALVLMPERTDALEGAEFPELEESLDVKAWAEENISPSLAEPIEVDDGDE